MGMTDRQFDAYLLSLLQNLERARVEVKEISNGNKSDALETIISNIESQLKRP